MRWVRAKFRAGARLALFALAVQIALSFGHVHVGDARHAAPLASTGTQPTGSAPTQHPVHDADGYCAICATIHLPRRRRCRSRRSCRAVRGAAGRARQLYCNELLGPACAISVARSAFRLTFGRC